jgi:hypothetical protein
MSAVGASSEYRERISNGRHSASFSSLVSTAGRNEKWGGAGLRGPAPIALQPTVRCAGIHFVRPTLSAHSSAVTQFRPFLMTSIRPSSPPHPPTKIVTCHGDRNGTLGFPRQPKSAALAVVGRTDWPPKWIKPQLTRLVDEAPEGNEWLHEIKYDGYRMHARIDGAKINCSPEPAWIGRIATGVQSKRLAP